MKFSHDICSIQTYHSSFKQQLIAVLITQEQCIQINLISFHCQTSTQALEEKITNPKLSQMKVVSPRFPKQVNFLAQTEITSEIYTEHQGIKQVISHDPSFNAQELASSGIVSSYPTSLGMNMNSTQPKFSSSGVTLPSSMLLPPPHLDPMIKRMEPNVNPSSTSKYSNDSFGYEWQESAPSQTMHMFDQNSKDENQYYDVSSLLDFDDIIRQHNDNVNGEYFVHVAYTVCALNSVHAMNMHSKQLGTARKHSNDHGQKRRTSPQSSVIRIT